MKHLRTACRTKIKFSSIREARRQRGTPAGPNAGGVSLSAPRPKIIPRPAPPTPSHATLGLSGAEAPLKRCFITGGVIHYRRAERHAGASAGTSLPHYFPCYPLLPCSPGSRAPALLSSVTGWIPHGRMVSNSGCGVALTSEGRPWWLSLVCATVETARSASLLAEGATATYFYQY